MTDGLTLLRQEFGVEATDRPEFLRRLACTIASCSGHRQRCTNPKKHIPAHLLDTKGANWSHKDTIYECDRCHTHTRFRTVQHVARDALMAEMARDAT